MNSYANFLKTCFFEYTSISSQSEGSNPKLPSSEGQREMALKIKKDLQALGVTDITLREDAVLIARIKGTSEGPSVAFMAHVDTVDIGVLPKVNAQLLKYEGKDLVLHKEQGIVFRAAEHPEAEPHIGQDIFFTDGTSVLGADDKAGVAVLTALAKFAVEEKPRHGGLVLVYTPDEEIGLKGAYALEPSDISADFCYTVDASGGVGRFAYETFNAARANICIEGVSIHPGRAKDILVNPVLAANHLINGFHNTPTPETTELRQGYFWIHKISGNPSRTELEINIRDFDLALFNQKKAFVEKAVAETQKAFPRAKISCIISDDYANIANTLGEDRRYITLAEEAYKAAGIPMVVELARGGTDGAVLSAKGLPTPNIFTGGLNAHSIYEFLPLPALEKSFETCARIVELAHRYEKK